MRFVDRLLQVQSDQNSLLCIGLDPDPSLLPASLGTSESAVFEFNKHIVEATHDLVCAYKLNLAFYEALGIEGWDVMKKTIALIPRLALTIGDGKRGDVGNTAERYAVALFQDCGFDAVTVNPYMGTDSVQPFLKHGDRGVFILALTSNPGSKDFQRLKVGGKPLYEKVVAAAKKWNTGGNVGLVVGATHPKELRSIRSQARGLPILIPGIGSQGGDLRAAVRFGCDENGRGALISVGRAVLYASKGTDYAAAARTAALRIRDEIRAYQEEFFDSQ